MIITKDTPGAENYIITKLTGDGDCVVLGAVSYFDTEGPTLKRWVKKGDLPYEEIEESSMLCMLHKMPDGSTGKMEQEDMRFAHLLVAALYPKEYSFPKHCPSCSCDTPKVDKEEKNT